MIPKKETGDAQVNTFLQALQHPLKEEIDFARALILKTCPGLTEHIKWNAPSFCQQGDDRITFNFGPKSQFRIIFHTGVKVKDMPGERLIADKQGLLKWATNNRAILELKSREDLEKNRNEIATIITDWLEATKA